MMKAGARGETAVSLDDDRWLFDGDAWSDKLLAEDFAALETCGDPDCDHRTCQDDDDSQADDDAPDYSTVTMTEVYDD
jgi:hypothetical protein